MQSRIGRYMCTCSSPWPYTPQITQSPCSYQLLFEPLATGKWVILGPIYANDMQQQYGTADDCTTIHLRMCNMHRRRYSWRQNAPARCLDDHVLLFFLDRTHYADRVSQQQRQICGSLLRCWRLLPECPDGSSLAGQQCWRKLEERCWSRHARRVSTILPYHRSELTCSSFGNLGGVLSSFGKYLCKVYSPQSLIPF